MYYYRGLSKKEIIDFLYQYFIEKQPGAKILKKNLKKFSKRYLARSHALITDLGKFPWSLFNKVAEKPNKSPVNKNQLLFFH